MTVKRLAAYGLDVDRAEDWRHEGECQFYDPELFFPIGTTGPVVLQIEEAVQVCTGCPVRAACLAWALETGQNHGIWGGMTEQERQSLKRREIRQLRLAGQQAPIPRPAGPAHEVIPLGPLVEAAPLRELFDALADRLGLSARQIGIRVGIDTRRVREIRAGHQLRVHAVTRARILECDVAREMQVSV